ncbi:MAG: holin family protein [Faecousia sp.]
MNEKLTVLKASLAALLSGLSAFLGWRGVMAVVWVCLMALDYISGTAAACKAGSWSSKAAREGLWHKTGMIFAVIVAAVADGVIGLLCDNFPALGITWPCIVLPLVLAWYIITELGSILENAVALGAAVPGWLIKILEAGLKAVDNTAGKDLLQDGQTDAAHPPEENTTEGL